GASAGRLDRGRSSPRRLARARSRRARGRDRGARRPLGARARHGRAGSLSVGHPTNAQILVAFAIDAVVGAAVGLHADRNGIKTQTAWAFFVVLFLVIALPVYALYVRSERRKRA